MQSCWRDSSESMPGCKRRGPIRRYAAWCAAVSRPAYHRSAETRLGDNREASLVTRPPGRFRSALSARGRPSRKGPLLDERSMQLQRH